MLIKSNIQNIFIQSDKHSNSVKHAKYFHTVRHAKQSNSVEHKKNIFTQSNIQNILNQWNKLTTVDPDWETVWNWHAAHLDNRQPRWWERWQRWPRWWLWWLFQSWPRWWWYWQGTPIEHAGWLVRTARSRTGSLISCWLYWCLSLLWCFWCQFSGM